MASFPTQVLPQYAKTVPGANTLIKPSSRRFSMGRYPVQTYTSLSGKTVRKSFGNKAFGYEMELSFQNVDEGVLNTIHDHYHGQGGSSEGFAIPSLLFAGYTDSATLQHFDNIDGISWFYAEPPSVESTTLGLSNITVNLTGDLMR